MAKTSTNSGSSNGAGIIIAVVVTLLVAGGGGFMLGHRTGENSANLEAQSVAVVNGEKITQMDLYNRMVQKGGDETLLQMIDERLVEQEAKRLGITVTDKEVDAEMDDLIARVGGKEAFSAALVQYNIRLEDLRADMAMNVKTTKIVTRDMPVDGDTLQQYFINNMREFDKREISARHILVDTEEKAKEVKALLDGGADFGAMAKEHSVEPGADQSGGDLGTFGRGRMVPEFENVVFNMKKGEVSAPFQSQFGWHIVNVLEVTGEAPVFGSMMEQVKQTYLSEKANDLIPGWIEELRANAKITNTLK